MLRVIDQLIRQSNQRDIVGRAVNRQPTESYLDAESRCSARYDPDNHLTRFSGQFPKIESSM